MIHVLSDIFNPLRSIKTGWFDAFHMNSLLSRQLAVILWSVKCPFSAFEVIVREHVVNSQPWRRRE